MKDNRRNVMRSVKINKNELLKIVRENKEKHINEYNESVSDYKKAVLKIADENLRLAKTATLETRFKNFPHAPSTYVDQYTKAIRMLELSVEDVIEIEEDIFNQLVLDEWNWKHQFVASSALYKSF